MSMKAGSEYATGISEKDKNNKTLVSLRGQWVDVDTTYLFQDQYNLAGYSIRVFDKDISAVRNDMRRGMVKCGYCGKQFLNMDALQEHYRQEEESAHCCENCKDYVTGIVDIQHDKSEEIDQDGNRIETRTTKYIYGKKCRWEKGCNKFEHRNHKPFIFTEENTYFLKYPNGYNGYFQTLTTAKKWEELGFTWEENLKKATSQIRYGSYYITLHYENGKLNLVNLWNSRNNYLITAEKLKFIFEHWYNVSYCLTYDPNGQKWETAATWENQPQAVKTAAEKAFDKLRTLCQSDYKKELILGGLLK